MDQRNKEKQDKLLKQQLEKEREQAIITEIEKNRKRKNKEKGSEDTKAKWNFR